MPDSCEARGFPACRWDSILDAPTDDGGTAVGWNAGEFLPGERPGDPPRAAVVISVVNRTRTLEGTYLLEGKTGAVRWFEGLYHDGGAIRGMIPVGIPSVFDWDGMVDVDGDGKGEFLTGRYCIGTDERGVGEVRWTAPVPLGWAIIADFDGDGKGEIAAPGKGRITILKGR